MRGGQCDVDKKICKNTVRTMVSMNGVVVADLVVDVVVMEEGGRETMNRSSNSQECMSGRTLCASSQR